MELLQTTSGDGNTAFAPDQIVSEIIDGILSEMVSKIDIKDGNQDGTVEMQKHDIDRNILLMNVKDDFSLADSMLINYDHVDDDFIDIDEYVNSQIETNIDELWNIETFDNGTLDTEESINNLLEELSDQKNVSTTKKRSYSGQNPLNKRNSNKTEKVIEEESLNNVDTFLKSISTSWSWTHVTEQQYSALETEFEISRANSNYQTRTSSNESSQQINANHFINTDLLSSQSEVQENPFFEFKRPKIVTDGGSYEFEKMSSSGTQTKFSTEDSGANRKQEERSIPMEVQKNTEKASSNCNFCSQRQKIEKLIG